MEIIKFIRVCLIVLLSGLITWHWYGADELMSVIVAGVIFLIITWSSSKNDNDDYSI